MKNPELNDFITALCDLMDTLSDHLTIQYYEENQEVWITNINTGNKLYMGNIYDIVDRFKEKGRKE